MSTTKQFSGTIKRETAKALRIEVDMICPDPTGGGVVEYTTTLWLPKSKITKLDDGRFEIPLWLAENEGLAHKGHIGRHTIVREAL